MEKTKLYTCSECGLSYNDEVVASFAYKEKDLAKKCQAWCKKYNSCNLEITKYSVNKKEL